MGKQELDNYHLHPTFTVRGQQENMVVGHLGEPTLSVKNSKGFLIEQQGYYAWGIKFKFPSEHRWGNTTYPLEIQVHLASKKSEDYYRLKVLLSN